MMTGKQIKKCYLDITLIMQSPPKQFFDFMIAFSIFELGLKHAAYQRNKANALGAVLNFVYHLMLGA